jgi:hypothetical protein
MSSPADRITYQPEDTDQGSKPVGRAVPGGRTEHTGFIEPKRAESGEMGCSGDAISEK